MQSAYLIFDLAKVLMMQAILPEVIC